MKTQELFRKGLNIEQIAKHRSIKVSTVWEHFANLIEHNQMSLWKVLPKEKITKILPCIQSPLDKLKDIKNRVKDETITYDELSCALAFVKLKNKKRNIVQLASWYQKTYCFRKCYLDKDLRKLCSLKFDILCSKNPSLEMTRKEFVDFFNNHLRICVLPKSKKLEYVSWQMFRARLSRFLSKKK